MNPQKENELFIYLGKMEYGMLYFEVYNFIARNHCGVKNAITLENLFHHFRPFEGFDIIKTRDEMRKICSEILPLCSCSKGVYYPMTKKDIEVFVNWMKPRVFAIFNRIKRIKEAHEEIYPNGHQFQLWEKVE